MSKLATGSMRWRACGRCSVFSTTTRLLVIWMAAATTLPNACGQQRVESTGSPADVAAIRAAATAYRESLAKGDADAVKAAWTADGDIVDGWGNRLQPQDIAPLKGGPAASTAPRPEVRLSETQLRFITADVAVEDGTVDVVLPGMKTSIEGWFSALWVRRGDSWKLAGLRESERPIVADANMLADLDWLVGDWILEVEPSAERAGAAAPAASTAMEMSVRWDAGHEFLVREARVPVESTNDGDPTVVEVHQRIGWDPLVRRVRSWSFSSDGSRGEATWFRDGDSWVAVQTAVLPSGRQETAVNVYSYNGLDRCVWRILPEALESDDARTTRATWVRKPKGVER
ncbi:MAG: nuclear transport factor 2 family protein [Planctomycetia bacterium]|nr:nuclear transport factor 2 family protein [Planctomycetia bacterium]